MRGRIHLAYDSTRRKTQVNVPESRYFDYSYLNGNFSQVSHNFGQPITMTYDTSGQPIGIVRHWGQKTSYQYDAAGNTTTLTHRNSSGTTLLEFKYTYDAIGNPTKLVEDSGDVTTWTYDAINQPSREERDGTNSFRTTYQYDRRGNIRRSTDESNTLSDYRWNKDSGLSRILTSGNKTTYTYDTVGNLTTVLNSDGTKITHTWTAANMLSTVQLPSGTINTFLYNGDGQRVKIYDSYTPSGRDIVWDGQNIIYESGANGKSPIFNTLTPDSQYGELLM